VRAAQPEGARSDKVARLLTDLAVRPCFQVFFRDLALPAEVFGPVLCSAFARFASICFSVLMLSSFNRPQNCDLRNA
jgi:hypothetical protein